MIYSLINLIKDLHFKHRLQCILYDFVRLNDYVIKNLITDFIFNSQFDCIFKKWSKAGKIYNTGLL